MKTGMMFVRFEKMRKRGKEPPLGKQKGCFGRMNEESEAGRSGPYLDFQANVGRGPCTHQSLVLLTSTTGLGYPNIILPPGHVVFTGWEVENGCSC